MKKIFFLFIIFITNTFFIFGLPDITLFVDKNEFCTFENNKMYMYEELIGEIVDDTLIPVNEEDFTDVLKFVEDNNTIIINSSENGKPVQMKFSKKTGNAIYFKMADAEASFYEETGLIKTSKEYENGKFKNAFELEYDDYGNITKEIRYDENNEVLSRTITEYKSNSDVQIFEANYGKNNELLEKWEYDTEEERLVYYYKYTDNHLVKKVEYNPKTGKKAFAYTYDKNEKVISRIIYDENTGTALEKQFYNSKKTVKYKFVTFDIFNTYNLEDGYYLRSKFCEYDLLKYRTEDFDWNEFYNATITKIDYDQFSPGYSVLQKLKDNKLLIDTPVTLCKANSQIYYCFNYTEDNYIDYSSCYQIILTRKDVDYTVMNKSGKGTGPFGFDIGMNYDDVKAACNGNEPEHISDDRYYVKPSKSHPQFETYVLWISKKYGVYYTKGIGRDIKSSEYGTEVKNQFNNLLTILERKYGSFKKTDTIKKDYSLQAEQYWMQALKDGARTYRADWVVPTDDIDKYDGLYAIRMGISTSNSYSNEAYIWIEYEFRNWDDANALLNDVL